MAGLSNRGPVDLRRQVSQQPCVVPITSDVRRSAVVQDLGKELCLRRSRLFIPVLI